MKYTPWEIYEYKNENGVKKIHIINSLGLIVAMPTGFDYKINKRNAEHIIKSVNSHDKFVDALKKALKIVPDRFHSIEYGEVPIKRIINDALKDEE